MLVVNFVHSLCLNMQGILTNETRCLRCETVTARDETFLDLSLDIEQNSSITSCLKNFSSTETLNAEDKFFCDKCCRLVLSASIPFQLKCFCAELLFFGYVCLLGQEAFSND